MRRLACCAVSLIVVSAAVAAPVPETDPLLIGTRWKGKLTQRGTFASGGMGPPEFKVVLTVTKRDRNRFEAELHEVAEAESLSITYLVKGEITRDPMGKGYVVAFQSFDSKDVVNTAPILGIPYRGTVTGKKVEGTWKMPKNDNGIDIEGDFSLELGR
jgi:hypothetical protein